MKLETLLDVFKMEPQESIGKTIKSLLKNENSQLSKIFFGQIHKDPKLTFKKLPKWRPTKK